MGQRVLITGISRYLGGKLAQHLEKDPDVDYIVGVDLDEPEVDLDRTEFVRADIRNPLVVKVLQTTEVDTVVHLSIVTTPTRVGGRTNMKEFNVIGAMQLFAACQKAESVKKLIMKSTTAVYGSDPRDPAVFTESDQSRSVPRTGLMKDAVELERYARDFGRRRSDVDVTILRFANFIGPDIETTLTRYFLLPVIPTAMGYDPRIQLIHEDDALEVLHRAVRESHPGIYNVAADGVVYLSQAVRLLGRPPLPVVLRGRHHPAGRGLRLHAAVHDAGGAEGLRDAPAAAAGREPRAGGAVGAGAVRVPPPQGAGTLRGGQGVRGTAWLR